MAVKARMRVVARAEKNWGAGKKLDAVEVKLQAVYSDDKGTPNYSFSQATPSGEVSLMITNPTAFGQFAIGQTFDVDFTPVD
jgi:hypothetical protein